MSAHLTAFEHQELAIGPVASRNVLTAAEADALAGLSERLGRFCDRGYRSVRLANFCGVVAVGSRLLEILPKIEDGGVLDESRGMLLNLLQQSSEMPVFHHRSAEQQLRRAPLIEAFIATFFDSVGDVIRGGLMRQYQEEQDDLRTVRGRIASARQFATLANRADIVACHFDELTADNLWNRFIKAGLRASRQWLVSAGLQRRWAELMIAFDEVADIDLPAATFDRLPPDRRGKRYLPAAEWVRRILGLESPALRAGAEAAPGLLFDMNVVWESAIASEFRRLSADSEVVIDTQVTGRYLASVDGSGRRAVGLRPDVVISSVGKVLGIADTKWKRLELGRGAYLKPTPEDLYQMHAYAASFECDTLALIYPWHPSLAASRETVLHLPKTSEGRRPQVALVCIDVRGGGFEVMRGRLALQAMGLLADRVKWPPFPA